MQEQFEAHNPFWAYLGFTIDREAASREKAVVAVRLRPELLQHQNLVHGGVISALIDSAGAWAFALSHQEGVRTINLSVQYLTPVTLELGELKAHAAIVRAGRRIVLAEVSVDSERGGEAARGQVIYSRAR